MVEVMPTRNGFIHFESTEDCSDSDVDDEENASPAGRRQPAGRSPRRRPRASSH
jgi:hypothetical protein